MKNKTLLYNNEAIGIVSIIAIMQHVKRIDISKAMIILPFVLHDDIIKFLNRKNSKVRSIEELIGKKIELFSNFNLRYYSLLNISVNSILIASELNFLEIKNKELLYTNNNLPLNTEKSFGKRTNKIIETSTQVAKLFETKTENLYLQFRIEL